MQSQNLIPVLRLAFQNKNNLVERKLNFQLWKKIFEEINKILNKIQASKQLYPKVYSLFYEKFFEVENYKRIKKTEYQLFLEIISQNYEQNFNDFNVLFENLVKSLYIQVKRSYYNIAENRKKRVLIQNIMNNRNYANVTLPEELIDKKYKEQKFQRDLYDFMDSFKIKNKHKKILIQMIELESKNLKKKDILKLMNKELSINIHTLKTIYYRFLENHKEKIYIFLKKRNLNDF